MKWYLVFVVGFLLSAANERVFGDLTGEKLKVLHLSFHMGCLNSFRSVAEALDLDVESWYIPAFPPKFLDGVSSNGALYNIGHDRAKRIWDLHKEEFDQFDVIFTSDTAPLARIFLQNGWKKPLIIWVCNRFDYTDHSNLDCDFPDQEFYDLFNQAASQSNVAIVANSEFEHVYARSKGVDLGSLIIKPFLQVRTDELDYDIREQFYLPAYYNETSYINLSNLCTKLGIESFGGRHGGLDDLKRYKGIIHLPYAYSTIALFESISLGIPYFIPSKAFLGRLMKSSVIYGNRREKVRVLGSYWHQNQEYLLKDHLYQISEWYNEDNSRIMTYFDSWQDMQSKIQEMDYKAQRKKIIEYAKWHQETMVNRWKDVFERVQ